jgi:hypothetical protein
MLRQKMEDDCKKLISGYEDDIINLSTRTNSETLAGLAVVLANIRSTIGGPSR